MLGATIFVTFVAPHANPPVFRIEDTAPKILADQRIAQLFLGGGLAAAEPVP